MTTVDPNVDVFDDLDSFLESQPQSVRDAADDAGEYFQLVRTLRSVRRGRHAKQSVVAKAMSTTQSAVSDLESCRTDPQISTLMRYARAVGARLYLRSSVEDVVRSEGADKWETTARRVEAPVRIHKRHLALVEADHAGWRVPA